MRGRDDADRRRARHEAVAAVAYIDPGNFATNIAGGAKYGFLLVWVIVAANLMRGARVRRRAAGVRPVELERRHLRRPGGDAGLHRPPHPAVPRRAVTMAPALVVLAVGVDATDALVVSQVVLSFGIPFALVPMIMLTRRTDVMGPFVNRRATTIVASIVAALIIALNAFLLVQTFFG